MRKRRAILHIGTAKTGSTTIQRMLAGNRARLRDAGFLVPISPGESNHFRLAIYAGRERAERMALATGEAGDAAYVVERFALEFGAEMRDMPRHIHTVLFSNEHCYRKLDTPGAIARLRELLAPWFSEFQILVYLRRQDEMAVSLYSTRLRNGEDRLDVLPDLGGRESQVDKLDWHALVERWATVFGRAAVRPRLFARDAFVGGDLLHDYAAQTGLDRVSGLEPPETQNSAMAAPAQEFLRRLNGLLDQRGADPAAKSPTFVRAFLDQHFVGRGRRPSRAQAEAFMARFTASNERLRATWFPERAELFSQDFSRYPEAPDPVPGETEVLQVALTMIARQAAEKPSHDAEAMHARAVRLHASERHAEARAMLNKALARRPGHLPALRLLFAMASAPLHRTEAEARLRRARRLDPFRDELLQLQLEHGMVFDPRPMAARPESNRRRPVADTRLERINGSRERLG